MRKLFSSALQSIALVVVVIVGQIGAASATAPTFTASLDPITNSIGPGGTSVLTYTITNGDANPITDLAFSTSLLVNVVFSTPANVLTTCDVGLSTVLTAADGGNLLTFSGYQIGAASSCEVSVDIEASAVTSHVINSDDLISSEGNSGSASVTLTVDSALPGFSLGFSPQSIDIGSTSTFTQTFDNTANETDVFLLNTLIALPTGLVVADVPNIVTDCVGTSGFGSTTTTAVSGANSITLVAFGTNFPPTIVDPVVAAGASCSHSVDVKSVEVGALQVTTQAANQDSVTGTNTLGNAKAVLTSVNPFAQMSFSPNPVLPGATTSLEITMTNYNRSQTITNLQFTDVLDNVFTGLAITGTPPTDPCGTGSSITGTTTLTFSGGTLAPEASCTFSVNVLVPANTTASSETNTTSSFTFDLDGTLMVENPVSHNLTVTRAPTISLNIIEDIVAAGSVYTARFTITSIDPNFALTDIAFLSDLTPTLPLSTFSSSPGTACGGVVTVTPGFNVAGGGTSGTIELVGGALGVSPDSCTFDVGIDAPAAMSTGTYSLTTEAISATVDGATVFGGTASDTFQVFTAPSLTIGFSSTNITPAGTVEAVFTLTNSSNAPTDASDIAFSVDLDTAFTGLVASSLDSNDCSVTPTLPNPPGDSSLIDFSGGTLAAGANCSFTYTLQLPAGDTGSTVTISSSQVTATLDSTGVTSSASSSDFNIVTLNNSITVNDNDGDPDNSNYPGSTTATVVFTLNNVSSTETHSSVFFNANLDTALNGLSANALSDPTISCGASSTFTFSGTTLSVGNAEILPGGTCILTATLSIPSGAADGTYNITSSFNFSISSVIGNFFFDPMSGSFTVEADVAPTIVSITSSASPVTSVAPIPMQVIFSEAISGFVLADDVIVSSGTAVNLVQTDPLDASRYTFEISGPTDFTTVTVQIAANAVTDLGGSSLTNTISEEFSIDYDTSALPTGVVTVQPNIMVNVGPVTASVTYTNATIFNLTNDKVNLITTGTASTANFVDNDTPNPDITIIDELTANPTIQISNIIGDGTIAIGIDAQTARNNAGDVEPIANSTESFSIDNTIPTVVISGDMFDPINSDFTINIDFTNPAIAGPEVSLIGFTSEDVTLGNAVISNFSGSAGSYSATITPIANGSVTIDINADVAQDDHQNGNSTAAQFSVLDSDSDGIYDFQEGTGDSDGDGIPDYLDTDSDNDGIPDSVEGNGDSDGDGILNYLDTSLDEDGDGIPDALESNNLLDTDGDGVFDVFDTDSDNDGISDFEESGALGIDTDGDGIDDAFDVDITGGVDANGDGIDDDVMLLDSDGDGIANYIDRDSDNDSVPDALENSVGLQLKMSILANQKLQLVASDTDGDGIMDYIDTDSDDDGISDLAEAATSFVDSDMDQIIDEFDVDFTGGLDVNLDGVDDAATLQNSDNDATPDMFDLDADNDGLFDVNEAGLTDLDLNALVDSPQEQTNTPLDSDSDGLADFVDLDSDNDGIFDIVNSGAATLDSDNDGQIDDVYAAADADADGIVDIVDEEPNNFGTRPDRDLDGVPSFIDLDDDGDGLTDIAEGNLDTDGDGLVDSLDTDSDNDGISDTEEQITVTLLNIDLDRDGLDDAVDVDFTGGIDADGDGQDDATFSTEDLDGDGLLAFRDTDTDGDGIPDSSENGDFNNDGVNDRLQVHVEVTATSGSGALFGLIGLLFLVNLVRRIRLTAKSLIKPMIILAAFMTFSTNAQDVDNSETNQQDWYAGFGIGQARFDPVNEGTAFITSDNDSNAVRAFIGLDFSSNWFAELGLMHLGKVQLTNNNPALAGGFINYNATQAAIGYKIRPKDTSFDVFAKAGWSGITTNSDFIEDEDESVAVFGAGIHWELNKKNRLRFEFEKIGDNVSLLSISLQTSF